MPKLTFGDRLSQIREQRGMTQPELARAVGSTQKNISKYETGAVGLPREPVLMKLAEVLDVSPGWLAFGHEDLDHLDEQAIRVAVEWNKLPKEHKEVFIKLLELHSNRAEDNENTK